MEARIAIKVSREKRLFRFNFKPSFFVNVTTRIINSPCDTLLNQTIYHIQRVWENGIDILSISEISGPHLTRSSVHFLPC